MPRAWRRVMTISLSLANPDAAEVLAALDSADVADGGRSALLLAWAASYLRGEARAALEAPPETVDEESLDALLDAF